VPMKMTHTNKIFSVILMALLIVAISSCKKDKKTIATISVVSSTGVAVPGASVQLAVPGASVQLYSACSECPPPAGGYRFDTTLVTNGAGKVSFDFTDFYKKGQAGFAVLDIHASKGDMEGDGIIKIEEETTTEEIVAIE